MPLADEGQVLGAHPLGEDLRADDAQRERGVERDSERARDGGARLLERGPHALLGDRRCRMTVLAIRALVERLECRRAGPIQSTGDHTSPSMPVLSDFAAASGWSIEPALPPFAKAASAAGALAAPE